MHIRVYILYKFAFHAILTLNSYSRLPIIAIVLIKLEQMKSLRSQVAVTISLLYRERDNMCKLTGRFALVVVATETLCVYKQIKIKYI